MGLRNFAREGDKSAFSWVEKSVTDIVTARIDEARLLSVAETVDAQLRGETVKPKS